MKSFRIIYSVVLPMMLFSCAKEMQQDNTQKRESAGITEITAGIADGQTKTVLGEDGVSVLWSPKDEINVFYDGDGLKFTSINTEPKDRTIFSSDQALAYSPDATDGGWIWGVYPYDSSNSSDGESVSLAVPSVQIAVEGSFGRNSFAAVGRSKNDKVSFYNVCGGIRFTVGQVGIRKISVRGNDGETLAGRVKVVFNAEGFPEVESVDSAATEVELYAPNEGEFEPDTWYYISMLPVKFEKGLKFTFFKQYAYDETGEKSIPESREIKRAVFGSATKIDSGVEFNADIKEIVLGQHSLNLPILASYQFDYKIIPSYATQQQVIWESDNENVAIVKDGLVYAAGFGKCTIKVVSVADETIFDSCQILVSSDITLDETMVECNAPMEFVSFGQGSTETGDHCYGLDGSPDWFMPLTETMAAARGAYLTEPAYMFDEDEATCYHTNLDWGVPYTSWGCREEEINYGQHYIQINFDSPLSSIRINVLGCNDPYVGDVFEKDETLIVKYTTDGEKFVISREYPWTGYGARIEDKVYLSTEDDSYAQNIIAIRFQTSREDDWTHTYTAFGIAELDVTAIISGTPAYGENEKIGYEDWN